MKLIHYILLISMIIYSTVWEDYKLHVFIYFSTYHCISFFLLYHVFRLIYIETYGSISFILSCTVLTFACIYYNFLA